MHGTPAEVKIVWPLVFVLAVVATPREMFWPFAVYAAIIVVSGGSRGYPHDGSCRGC